MTLSIKFMSLKALMPTVAFAVLFLIPVAELKAAGCPDGTNRCVNGCTVSADDGVSCTTYCSPNACPLGLTTDTGETQSARSVGNSYTFSRGEFNFRVYPDKVVLTPKTEKKMQAR